MILTSKIFWTLITLFIWSLTYCIAIVKYTDVFWWMKERNRAKDMEFRVIDGLNAAGIRGKLIRWSSLRIGYTFKAWYCKQNIRIHEFVKNDI